jgi:hypothetical protein
MHIHRIIFALVFCAALGPVLMAAGPDYALMEAQWRETMARGAVIEIHGAAEFTPALQKVMSLSERFTGDFTHGTVLAQLPPSKVEEAKALMQSSRAVFTVHASGTDAVFDAVGGSLFADLAQTRHIRKTPAKIQRDIHELLLSGQPSPPAAAGDGTRACSSLCSGFPEGFEGGSWYEEGGNWYHFQTGYSNNHGQYFWADNICDAHTGIGSADAIRGGTIGSSLGCYDTYPGGLTYQGNDTWMNYVYWITCASGATCANLSFYYKVNTVHSNPIGDYMGYFASLDGSYFTGYVLDGNYSGSWYNISKDLRGWYILGDLTTHAQFALMYDFTSDASSQSGWGARVDDISVTSTGSGSAPSCAGSPSPSSGATGISTPVTLTWGAVSGADAYAVYLGTSGSPAYLGTVYSPSCSTGSLSAGTVYYWQIVPFNASGSASGCPVWNFTTAGGAPSCAINPSPPDGTTSVSTSPTLSWPSVSGATSYDVYFGAGSSPPYVTNTAGTSYAPGGLSQNTTYYWRIAPKNGSGTAGGCPVWSFTTTGGSGGCSGSPVFIAAAAHVAGGGGSQWRTDVGLYNTGGGTSTVSVKYLPQGGSNASAACLSAGTISGSACTSLDDVVLSLAGLSSSSGGLAVYSTTPLVVNSRTYNQASSGTFGQGIPGHPASQALGAGSQRVLIQLHENSDYRTNVGFLNTGSGNAAFTLTLYNASGNNLGTLPQSLLPYEQKQINQVFRQVTSASIKNGRIQISVSSGAVLVYASVVDNATGDPTFIEPQN